MRSNKALLYCLCVLKIVLPFLIQDSYYQPHRDEFLYLAEGRHLAWGYMEVPPVLSVFAWLVNVAGGNEFWIKFWPNLVGAGCYLLMGRMVLSLGGKKFALLLAFLPFVFGAYLRVFHLFQPNFIEIFCWTLISYSLIRFLQTEKTVWLYCFGAAIGIGMLSKYTVAFFTLSILLGLLLTPQRRIFRNPHLYGAGALALLIFLPNLLWQYNHNFPFITHMNELKETQLQYNETGEFISSQFMMQLPVVFVWLAGFIYLGISREARTYRFYAWAFIIVVLLMIYLKGKGYYILGVYPMLFAFGSVWLEQLTSIKWRGTRYAMTAFAFITGILAIPFLLPVSEPQRLTRYYEAIGSYKTGDFKWEDLKSHPLPQDFADMMGWRELTEATSKAYQSLPDSTKIKTLIIGADYSYAGALNYYGPGYGLPEVYSTNASFLWWIPERLDVRHMLYVDDDYSPENPIFQQFEKVTLLDSINMPLFREDGTKVYFFENGSDSLNVMLSHHVKALKSKFLR